MAEPIFTFLAGLTLVRVAEDITVNCLYDLLKSGAQGSGEALRRRLGDAASSGELPANHTVERGMIRAALNATLATLAPVATDDLAKSIVAKHNMQDRAEDVRRACEYSLKDIRDEFNSLLKLYHHSGWDTPRRQEQIRRRLDDLTSFLKSAPVDSHSVEGVIAQISGNPNPSATETFSAVMLEAVVKVSRLPHPTSLYVRSDLESLFLGGKARWQALFPLFFAQELKDDPELHAILVQQRLSWNAEAVAKARTDLQEFRKLALDQGDALMNRLFLASGTLDTLVQNDARNARYLSQILSVGWLLDGASRAAFQDMFRDPNDAVSRTRNVDESAVRFHYSYQSDDFVGRDEKMGRIEKDFLDFPSKNRSPIETFRWMAICGEAGTGKSRMAQEIIDRNLGRYRLAGFASDGLLKAERFGRDNQDRIKHPVLIIVDYTVGYQDKMPEFMKGWADYARNAALSDGPPVRIIMLLRRPDEKVLDEIRSLGGNMADDLVVKGEVFGKDDPMLLQHLDRKDTIDLMRARIRRTAESYGTDEIDTSNESKLLDTLKRFDEAQRPLFAIMIAHAMQRGTLPSIKSKEDQENARFQLFSSYLKGQCRSYWRTHAGVGAPTRSDADDIVVSHVNLMRICTTCGGVARNELESFLQDLTGENEDLCDRLPTHRLRGPHRIRDSLLVSMAGGRGEVRGEVVDPLPTLEPDLIGECSVLMSWKNLGVDQTLWCEADDIVGSAWRIEPNRTANFLRLMALDYPRRMHEAGWFPVKLGDVKTARVRARLLHNIFRDTSYHDKSSWIGTEALSRMFDLCERFEEELTDYIEDDPAVRAVYGQIISRLSNVAANIVNPNVELSEAPDASGDGEVDVAISRRFSSSASAQNESPPEAFEPAPDALISLVVNRMPRLELRAKSFLFLELSYEERLPFVECVADILGSVYWIKRDDIKEGGYWPVPRTEAEATEVAAFRDHLIWLLNTVNSIDDIAVICRLFRTITYADWDVDLDIFRKVSLQVEQAVSSLSAISPAHAESILGYFGNFIHGIYTELKLNPDINISKEIDLVDGVFSNILDICVVNFVENERHYQRYFNKVFEILNRRRHDIVGEKHPLANDLNSRAIWIAKNNASNLCISDELILGITVQLSDLPFEDVWTEQDRVNYTALWEIFDALLRRGRLQGEQFRRPGFENLSYFLWNWVFRNGSLHIQVSDEHASTLIDLFERQVGERARTEVISQARNLDHNLWPPRPIGPLSHYFRMLRARDGVSDKLADATLTVWAQLLLKGQSGQVLDEVGELLEQAQGPLDAASLQKSVLAFRGIALLAIGFAHRNEVLAGFADQLNSRQPLGRGGAARLYRAGMNADEAESFADAYDQALSAATFALAQLGILSDRMPETWWPSSEVQK